MPTFEVENSEIFNFNLFFINMSSESQGIVTQTSKMCKKKKLEQFRIITVIGNIDSPTFNWNSAKWQLAWSQHFLIPCSLYFSRSARRLLIFFSDDRPLRPTLFFFLVFFFIISIGQAFYESYIRNNWALFVWFDLNGLYSV